jgi:hypothetical protein
MLLKRSIFFVYKSTDAYFSNSCIVGANNFALMKENKVIKILCIGEFDSFLLGTIRYTKTPRPHITLVTIEESPDPIYRQRNQRLLKEVEFFEKDTDPQTLKSILLTLHQVDAIVAFDMPEYTHSQIPVHHKSFGDGPKEISTPILFSAISNH